MKKIKILLGLLVAVFSITTNADLKENYEEVYSSDVQVVNELNANEYRFGEGYGVKTLYTKHDSGFAGGRPIEKGDYHNGWEMGYFSLTGFAQKSDDIFYKTKEAGEVKLNYTMVSDLYNLPNSKVKISEDYNGYIVDPNVSKQNMGEGYFVLEFTDENGVSTAINKRNFLQNPEHEEEDLILNEEGDYRVTLVYELKKKVGFIYQYDDYKVQFDFQIMNGTTEFATFDKETNLPIGNRDVIYNGFSVNFLESKSFDVKVKWEILSKDGQSFDNQMFEKVVYSGQEFEELGKYTITAYHKTLNLSVEKVIYIGCAGYELASSIIDVSFEGYYQNQKYYDALVDAYFNPEEPEADVPSIEDVLEDSEDTTQEDTTTTGSSGGRGFWKTLFNDLGIIFLGLAFGFVGVVGFCSYFFK